MALDIYTNNYSIIAQNNLSIANSSLSKSIERLSSGLRINHAADDASGLAISEKLRGQIRGLAKASMNAQDAISFLQTAEGGMEVIGDMLQRMRELAVQAGNGTYTANDRKELQKEVDQLKAEINRISSSTEYNTKKLLTGDAAALWSSDSDDIEAIVRGAPAEGNYKLNISTIAGTNSIYKTDIMDLKNPGLAASFAPNANFTSITFNTNVLTAGTTISASISAAAIASAVATVAVANGTLTALTVAGSAITTSGYFVFDILDVTGAAGSLSVRTNISFVDTGGNKNILDTVDFSTAIRTINYVGNVLNVTFSSGSTMGRSIAVRVQDSTVASATRIRQGTQSGVYTLAADQSTSTSVVVYTAHGSLEFLSANINVNDVAAAGLQTTVTNTTIASETTRLRDIDRFYNADGRFILDNPQELTIYANGQQTKISIEGCDTIGVLKEKLNGALLKLGMGATTENSTAAATVNGNLVQYIHSFTAQRTGANAVAGTFIIQSARMGEESAINFIGDENLINALSIANIQDGKSAQTQVVVTDAHTGKGVGADLVCDGMLRGVIGGIDVKVGGALGASVVYNTATQSLNFNSISGGSTAYLHVVDHRTEVQIGANEGQKFDVSIAQMDTTSLEIDDAYVMTMDLSQKAITKFDQALEKVNSARATIGAQINRVEYTMKNLSVARQNLIAAESRIRDLDVADESATFAKNQILVNAAVAMLAQANALPQVALQLIGR